MKEYIIYTRVSTDEQEKSGLGLEAQLTTCRNYINSVGGLIIGEYSDTETGRSDLRTGLAEALNDAKLYDATIVFAKLDRFTRDPELGHRIRKQGIKLHFCDSPNISKMEYGLKLLLGEDELDRNSTRTEEALAVVKETIKRDGYYVSKAGNTITRLGNPRPEEAARRGGAAAAIVNRQRKEASVHWKYSFMEASRLRNEGWSYEKIRKHLNDNEFKNSRGGTWSKAGVYGMLNG